MKLYLLSIMQPDGPPPPPEVLGRVMQELGALDQELKASGSWVFNGGLFPASSATVVKSKDGELLMTDGPYAEGKEHLGGIVILKARDLDAALEWAGKFARIIPLPIEVRPFQSRPGE